MSRRVWLSIGIAATGVWLLYGAHFAVDTLAHGVNSSALKWTVCKKQTPNDIAGCDERLKADSTAELNHRWFLIAVWTLAPIAAVWGCGLGVAAVSRRRKPAAS
jgi:hypothetical protein